MPPPRWFLAITALLCTLVLTSTVIHTSMLRGRLAFFPRMDDVMYMARGAELVRAAREGAIRAGPFAAAADLARDWRLHPPHSPWTSSAAALGYGLFGFRDWAPYLFTSIPVFAFLLCAARLARRAGPWQSHALVVFAATAPFLAASVYILKPDFAAGICAAIAMMKALRAPVLTASRSATKRLIWTGVFFGLALLAKPAMMLPTVMLALGTLTLCTARDLMLRRGHPPAALRPLPRIVRAWALVLGAMVLIALPHYLFAWHAEWGYIRDTLTGKGTDMWGYRGTLAQHATYYLTGPGGHMMLGGLRSLIPLGFAIALAAMLAHARLPGLRRALSRRRTLYVLTALAALGMAWAGPTLAQVKIQQFASCFTALLWLIGIQSAAAICAAARARPSPLGLPAPRLVASAGVLALLVCAISTHAWTFPLWPARAGAPARAARDGRDRFVHETYEVIRTQAADKHTKESGGPTLIVAGGQHDVAGPLLTLWSIRDGVELTIRTVNRTPITTDPAHAQTLGRAAFDSGDLLLVGAGVASTAWPTVIQADADAFYLELARTDPRFQRIARTTDAASGAVFEVYRRVPSDKPGGL